LERHPVRYVQSASVLAMLRTHYGVDGANDGFVGFGDPVFDYDSFRAGRPEHEGGTGEKGRGTAGIIIGRYADLGGLLSRLQASGDEVRAIGNIFRRENRATKEFFRSEAREEEAKGEEIGRYGYLHFSTHGILSPKLQSIAFSQVPDSSEDGFLTLGEIMNLKYKARLIVLSACQTGLGWMELGEGVTGMTRAFMYAGSPAVVVSLWSVDDIGTRDLMVRFYEHMIGKGAAKDEALRAAKREMLKTRFRHPFFWSAFVMYGE
jgi:CHAT domain-containing protein